jgi:hypothetical protein
VRVWLGADCSDPRAGLELPFPCVWVAPWWRSEGVEAVTKSLSVTLLTSDQDVVSAVIAEPSIPNVTVGDPTQGTDTGHLPHDGYLADFLMRTKAVHPGARADSCMTEDSLPRSGVSGTARPIGHLLLVEVLCASRRPWSSQKALAVS